MTTRRVAAVSLAVAFLAISSSWSTAAAVGAVPPEQAWGLAHTRLMALAGPSSAPFGSTAGGTYRRTNAYAWTAGFYPASLWLLYAHSHEAAVLAQARRYTDAQLSVAGWRGTHDLGFMVGLPAGLALRYDPDATRRGQYAAALDRAARTLSLRWNPRVHALKSAEYLGKWGVIIDSAMNAPLLISAGQRIGGPEGARLVSRGRSHLLTLATSLVRADGSTFHRMAFDPRTGRALGPVPGQGLGRSSTWSRGQAWAVNGFTQGFRLTGDVRLLEAARRTADFWIARVPMGTVPAWDLDVTDPTALRDASAGAIAADALLSLGRVETDPDRADRYTTYARSLLSTLLASPFVDTGNDSKGLLQQQAYSVPVDARPGTYVWGDTFLLESLSAIGRQ